MASPANPVAIVRDVFQPRRSKAAKSATLCRFQALPSFASGIRSQNSTRRIWDRNLRYFMALALLAFGFECEKYKFSLQPLGLISVRA